jgi:hypothetical protein
MYVSIEVIGLPMFRTHMPRESIERTGYSADLISKNIESKDGLRGTASETAGRSSRKKGCSQVIESREGAGPDNLRWPVGRRK